MIITQKDSESCDSVSQWSVKVWSLLLYILVQSGLLLSEAALNVKCGALSVRTRHSRDALLQVDAALTLVTALALVLCHRLTMIPCHGPRWSSCRH